VITVGSLETVFLRVSNPFKPARYMTNLFHPEDYETFLHGLKERIRTAQVRAALAVNRELTLLYWQIGQDILLRQQQQG
jgi:hypothetical protein